MQVIIANANNIADSRGGGGRSTQKKPVSAPARCMVYHRYVAAVRGRPLDTQGRAMFCLSVCLPVCLSVFLSFCLSFFLQKRFVQQMVQTKIVLITNIKEKCSEGRKYYIAEKEKTYPPVSTVSNGVPLM